MGMERTCRKGVTLHSLYFCFSWELVPTKREPRKEEPGEYLAFKVVLSLPDYNIRTQLSISPKGIWSRRVNYYYLLLSNKYSMFILNPKIRVWILPFKVLKCHEIKCPRFEISSFLDSNHMSSAHTYTGSYRKAKEAILQQPGY